MVDRGQRQGSSHQVVSVMHNGMLARRARRGQAEQFIPEPGSHRERRRSGHNGSSPQPSSERAREPEGNGHLSCDLVAIQIAWYVEA